MDSVWLNGWMASKLVAGCMNKWPEKWLAEWMEV
jgi:hypothetical protein